MLKRNSISLECESVPFSSFSLQRRPLTLVFGFQYPSTVLSDSEKGLCDDTFFKPFSWALPSVRSAFGAPKASKMSKRLLQFQNRHNFSLQHVLPFFSKVSLATFLADQLKSVQADTELDRCLWCENEARIQKKKLNKFFQGCLMVSFSPVFIII